MSTLLRRLDDWREPTAPTKTDAIAGSLMGCEYHDDDMPPAPQRTMVTAWPFVVSLLVNVLLLGALVKVVVGR
jgi:hypothetical protein